MKEVLVRTKPKDSFTLVVSDNSELSESQDAAWCKIRSVLNPKSASYNYLQRQRGDKDQISDNIREIGHLRFPVGSGLYQRNRELCFRREGKD